MKGLMCLIILLYLAFASFEDIKKKTMDIRLFALFCLLLAVFTVPGISREYVYRFAGCIPGLLLLFISFISREQIGKGDALIVTALGFALGLSGILGILFLAWTGAFVTAAIMLVSGKRKKRFAFIPYIGGGCFLYFAMMLFGGL